MKFQTYFLSSIICYLGLACGLALMRIAPEEKKQLHGVFRFIRISSVFLVFIFASFYYYNRIVEFISLLAYAVFVLFLEIKSKDEIKKLMINYAVLAVVFYLSSSNLSLFLISSSLIFIYGTALASINPKKEILAYGSIFLILSNLLLTISHF